MWMLKAMGLILMCLGTFPALSQSRSDYQAATITAVLPHQPAGSDTSAPSYDVSLRMGNTVYVVLYTPPLGLDTAMYAAGHELLVSVGTTTITFNDRLGNSGEVPIINRTTMETRKTPANDSPPPQAPIKSTALVGLAGVKQNTVGTVAVKGGELHFVHSEGTSGIAAAAMEDVVTGDDSQRMIRGTLGTLSMFGPYGSGRALSLFRSKIDTLTIQYRDADGALHGVVFAMPVGKAESVKQELIAQGAHTRVPAPRDSSADSPHSANLEQKP
jgi:hypothetical protein